MEKNIIVVDSSQQNLDILSKELRNTFEVTTKKEVEDSLKLIKNNKEKYSFIILGSNININYREVIDKIKNINPNLKVGILTTKMDENLKKIAKENNMYLFGYSDNTVTKLEEDLAFLLRDRERLEVKNFMLGDNDALKYISILLHNLGIPSHLKGYNYLLYGIILMINDETYKEDITKRLYPMIANVDGKSNAETVERAIRTSIEEGWLRGDVDMVEDIFGYSIDSLKSKPTNAMFIVTVAERIKNENEIALIKKMA